MSNTAYTPPGSVVPFFVSDKFVNLIAGPVGCLAGSTLVLTEFGPTPIADITLPMRVLSWNDQSCRFQLSWCGGSFPKGRENLFRVSTPQGEFDAAGSHLLLTADGEYRRVEDLRPGHVLASYCRTPLQTTEELFRQESHEGARRSTKIDVDYLGGCAALNRLRGRSFLSEEGVGQASAPSPVGARTYTLQSFRALVSPWRALLGGLFSRTPEASPASPLQTRGYPPPGAPLLLTEASHTSGEFSSHDAGLFRQARRSPLTSAIRRPVQSLWRSAADLVCSFRSPEKGLTTPNRPILAITQKEAKEVFWDIQVADTHNYVTIDGAIHHNSSKTTASLIKIAYEAKRVAACKDGVRRSRCVVVRNTSQQLSDTTIPDFLKWFPEGDAGTYLRTEKKFILKFDDVQCEVMFRGLDDQNDVRRLLSLQLSFAVMDEFREIHADIFNALTGRLGRYPDKSMNNVGCCDDTGKQTHKIWGATNPPDVDSFWEKYLTELPKNAFAVIQPSGLSPEADWAQYLPEGYYENLCEGKTEDWIDVYVHAKFGRTLVGRPVYDKTFNEEFHVAKSPLLAFNSPSHPIVIGMDFGRTPAAVIGQRNAMGQVVVCDELVSENMGLEQFITTMLKPLLASRFPGMPYIVAGDPAGWAKSQINEDSCADVLKRAGFRAIRPNTNAIDARLRAVESMLMRQVGGKAGLLIDPRCKMLIKGFRSGYKYKAKKDGTLDETPDKGPLSHCHDALQYYCMLIDGAVAGAYQNKAREVEAVVAGGWT